MRTLEDIERELEVAKKEAKPLIEARDEAVKKCNKLYQEIEDYKIQNGLYFPMSELEKYKGREISHIKLVVREENGELSTKDMYNHEMFSIDKNGHLDFSSYHFGVMNYDEKTKKYIYSYHYCPTVYDFIGYLEIEFENDEESE